MSKIIESKKIIDVLNHVNKNTLVLFDIDNTLIWSIEEFGSLEWSSHISSQFHKDGLDIVEAIRKSCAIFEQIGDLISFKPVESDTLDVLSKLNKKKIGNIALTKRMFSLSIPTVKHLISAGINFSNNSLHTEEVVFDDMFAFSKGVLYSGLRKEKGSALIKFLEKINHKPDNILFIDDSQHHFKEVHENLNSYGIPTTCIRYGGADHRSKTFDPARADSDLIKVVGQERFDLLFKEQFVYKQTEQQDKKEQVEKT